MSSDRSPSLTRTYQFLVHHTAKCFDCGAECSAKNALAWAHNHARRHGHTVELQLGWQVRPERGDA